MAQRTILVPTDYSKSSNVALRYATSLARDFGARLLVAHVVPIVPPMSEGFVGYLPPPVDLTVERGQLERVVPDDDAVPCDHELLHGLAAEEILRCAAGHNVELIVMGSHGRTGVMRALLGSVSEEVVRKAECPVLTVKDAAAMAVATGESS